MKLIEPVDAHYTTELNRDAQTFHDKISSDVLRICFQDTLTLCVWGERNGDTFVLVQKSAPNLTVTF